MRPSTTISFPLVGGTVDLVLYTTDGEHASRAGRRAQKEGERLQKIFNMYDPDSSISALNRERVLSQAPEELIEVLLAALQYCERTDGAYDITLGRAFLARKKGMATPRLSCSWRDVHLTGSDITLTHPDVLLDVGSIAKGYIADRILECVRQQGIADAFIDARGDLRAIGHVPEVVDIAHPREPGANWGTIVITNQAVATSGDYRQNAGTYAESHILGAKEVSSATVIAPTAMDADVLATVLTVLNPEQRKALLDTRPQVKALLITTQLEEITFNGFESSGFLEVLHGA